MISDLYQKLRALNIKIRLVAGRLDISGPKGIITQDLLQEIKKNKDDLIDFISYYRDKKRTFRTIQPAPVQSDYVLSSSQRRLWIMSQFEGGNSAYNIPGVFIFKGALERDKLIGSLHRLLERHEILRTIFIKTKEGEIRQRILTTGELGFKVGFFDLQDQDISVLQERVSRDVSSPFNLSEGPLLRVNIYEIPGKQYVFCYVMHHIISDGWSAEVLIKEVLQFYDWELNGRDDDLVPLRIQYKDFAHWEQQELESETLLHHQDYWLDRFQGEIPVLNLMGDRARPAVKTYHGNVIPFRLNGLTSAGLKQLGHDTGSTLFMVLLASVKVLMYRYSGQRDLVIGTPVAGRDHVDLEEQIGFYVNTLALRTSVRFEDPFTKFLDRVKETALGAFQHQAYPFDALVEQLDLGRDRSRNPLFDVMVVLQNIQHQAADSGNVMEGLDITGYDGNEATVSKFDLNFTFAETNDGILLQLEYNTDIFDKDTIQRLGGHLIHLLESILEDPGQQVGQLKLLNEEEEGLLSTGFKAVEASYSKSATLITMFEAQVEKYPDHIALVHGKESVTYRELNHRSNRLARFLRTNYDIQPDDLVAISLERGIPMIVAIMGVLKSGGAYVPIDPAYPEERKRYMEADCKARLLIDEQMFRAFEQDRENFDVSNPNRVNRPEDLCYVIYTSGTTGKPKGTLIQHSNVVRLFKTEPGLFDFSPSDVWTMFHSFCFDFSVWEMYGALLFGGKLVVVPKETTKDPGAYLELLRSEGVTILNQTPSFFYNIAGREVEEPESDLNLRWIIFGGEALSTGRLSAWHSRYPAVRLVNMYGITETTVHVTYKEITTNDILNDTKSIGRSIPTLCCYILDEHLQLCPVGVPGQICISGAGLARGYLNRPELTSEKFVSNPYREGARLYLSGDSGRWKPNGTIDYLGRLDKQVKIRGYRIELGEIEHVLAQHPSIETAVVTTLVDNSGAEALVAYLQGSTNLSLTEIRTFLAQSLPQYMLPSHFTEVEEFPLTANGKLDRNALPHPESLMMSDSTGYIAPRTDTEAKMVEIWAEVLGQAEEKIGIQDNFFDLGGHSLKMMQVMARVDSVFKTQINIQYLFSGPTIERIAQYIDHLRATPSQQRNESAQSMIQPAGIQPDYVLSSSQRRLWILSKFEGGSAAYNVPAVYVFDGPVDVEALNHSFSRLVERHEILRTVFISSDGMEARQVVLDTAELNVSVDFQIMDEDAEALLQDLLWRDSVRPFDLARGPLLRAGLYKVAESRYIFSLVMHHIISDGWSLNIMVRELLNNYQRYCEGNPEPLPPLPIQYKDFAHWQQKELKRGAFQKQKEYWLEKFSGDIPVLQLPADKVRPPVKTYRGATLNHHWDASLTEPVLGLAQASGSTLFMVLLAAVKALLYRYTGQGDIVIGTPIAGRDQLELEEQVGFYINTLALRTTFDGKVTFMELLRMVKTTALGAYDNQAYPFDTLVEDLEIRRDMSRHPLFDVLLMVQTKSAPDNEAGENTEVFSVSNYDQSNEQQSSKFDLSFTFEETSAGISLQIGYNTDIYSFETIRRLGVHLERLMEEIVREPNHSIAELDYLPAEERNRLVTEFNQTKVEFDTTATLLTLFSEQVSKTPGAVAIVEGYSVLTFEDLDKRSDKLAGHLLQKYAVLPDELIGICMERSTSLVVAILGVLKSGAAYLPIDPGYPEERKKFMIQDSGCRVLIEPGTYREMEDAEVDPDFPFKSPGIQPHNLAYVIYTSGSTGKPKGVLVEHGNVVARMHYLRRQYRLDTSDHLIFYRSHSFDAAIEEYLLPLMIGATCFIAPPEFSENLIANLIDYIGKWQITKVNMPPVLLEELIREAHGENLSRLSSLKHVVSGGDKLSVDIVNQFVNTFDAKLYNAYGPTENTDDSTVWEAGRLRRAVVPIGKPIDNSTVYILDNHGGICPIGIPGEICVGGAGLARGYLNRPGLTEQRFVADPILPGERIYRTGDIGRWLPDGNIEFFGRRDDQVKIRGYRIELGEIEHAIRGYGAVRSCALKVFESDFGSKELVAYLVGEERIDLQLLRSFLSERLPVYMVPGYFMQLDKLPLNRNGKLDKKALPAPETGIGAQRTGYVSPRNEVEEQLAIVYREVLKKSEIGATSDFFALGGDSIKSIQVVARLRQRGYALTIKDVLLAPVLEELALRAKKVSRSIPQDLFLGEIPLGPIQADFLHRHPEHTNHFNQSVLLASTKPISAEVLQKCLDRLVIHHDALRMVFRKVSGRWTQQNLGSEQGYGFEEISVGNEEEYRQHCDRIQASLNVNSGPLLKTCLFHTAGGDRLLIVAHHLIMDGVSWRIMFEDLSLLYGQLASNSNVSLPLKTDAFGYWLNQLHSFAHSAELAEEQDYWTKIAMSDIEELPLDNPEGGNLVRDLESSSFELDASLTNTLVTKCNRQYRTDINDLLLTALSAALGDTFSVERVVINMEGHGREDIGTEIDVSRTVGWFTTVYPVVLPVSPESVIEQLISVKECLHRIPNKGLGYGLLKEVLEWDHDLPSDIVFNYLGDFGSGTEDPGGEPVFSFSGDYRGQSQAAEQKRDNKLDVSGLVVNERMQLIISYSREQFQSDTISRLLEAFERRLKELIEELSTDRNGELTPIDLTYQDLTREQVRELSRLSDLEDVYLLGPLQEGLYYHWMSNPASTAYLMQTSYQLQGELDLEVLRQSYERLIERHAVLRTTFTQSFGDRLLQVVSRNEKIGFRFIEEPSGELSEYQEEDLRTSFNLHKGPLLRLTVVRLAEDRYGFIWSYHHILMDGWCSSVLSREFFEIYLSLKAGKEPVLPPVTPYADYIRWLSGRDVAGARRYWREYLAGYDTLSTFNGLKHSGTEFLSEEMHFHLSGTQRATMRKVCLDLGITENTFIQVIWGLLLSWYNNTEDVVFGAVVSGRSGDLPGVEEMIGLFINSIPVRLKMEAHTAVRTLLRKAQDEWIEGAEHHHVQLAQIQAESETQGLLFDHILQYQNLPAAENFSGGLENEKIKQGFSLSDVEAYGDNTYDLTFVVVPGDEQLSFVFKYNGIAFRQKQMEGIRDHFLRIAAQVLENPEIQVRQALSLNAEDQRQILEDFSLPALPAGDWKAITDLFDEQAEQNPARTALLYRGCSQDYGHLQDQANRLANYLVERYQVQKGELVGLMLDHSDAMIVALLAILKSGCAYVPIDPAYPPARKAFVANDTKIRLLITQSELIFDADFFEGSLFAMDIQMPTLETSGASPVVDLQPEDTAYVIYTSGSTGQPKGCIITHGNLANYIAWANDYYFDKIDYPNFGLFTSISFDLTVTSIFCTLTGGGELSIYGPGQQLQEVLADIFHPSTNSNAVKMTPSHMMILRDLGIDTTNVRCVILGGEEVRRKEVELLKSIDLSIRVFNEYGPTEATVGCIAGELDVRLPVTIGQPIAGTNTYILDHYNNLCPVGIPGEICIGGKGVGKGYLNRKN